MHSRFYNNSYKPKIHFPPRSTCDRLLQTTNDYSQKVPLNDLMKALEHADNEPQINYDSNSETPELSSSNSSPSPTLIRYTPPLDCDIYPERNSGLYTANSPELLNAKPLLTPGMNPDLQNYLLNLQNGYNMNVLQNMNYWLSLQKDLSDEEKNEYLMKIKSLSVELNGLSLDYQIKSAESQLDTSFTPNASHSKTYKKLNTASDVGKYISLSRPPTASKPNDFKLYVFRKTPLKKHWIGSELPEWWKKRNEHFKKCWKESEDCICHRPSIILLCRVCGFRAKSRIRRPCKIHPNTVFFTDIDQCGNCRTYAQLGLFTELPFKKGLDLLK